MKQLETEAWEDFLDMTISQALLWAATNTEPEKRSSEIAAAGPISSVPIRGLRSLGQRPGGPGPV